MKIHNRWFQLCAALVAMMMNATRKARARVRRIAVANASAVEASNRAASRATSSSKRR